MMLEPADAVEVVPGVGLMTQEALLDARNGLPGINRSIVVKWHHEGTGRRPMTL